MQLRTKFTLLICFLFVGAALIIWFGARPGYEQAVIDERITIVTEYQREKVQKADEMVELWYTGVLEIQQTLSETSSIQNVQTLFGGFSGLIPEMHSLRLVEEDTGEFIEIRSNPSVSGIDFEGLDFQSRRFRENALFTAYDSENRKFIIASNFQVNNEPFRMVVLFDASSLNEILFSQNLGANEVSVLWMDQETAISQQDVPDFRPGYEPISKTETVTLAGIPTIVLSSPIDALDALYVIYLDQSAIQAPVRRLFSQSIGIVGISFLILALVSLVLFKQLTNPINQFLHDLQPLASYNFTREITPISIPELESVSHTMEEIRRKLLHYQKINVEQIISSQEKNKVMMDYATDLIAVFDGPGNFTFQNNRFLELFDDIKKEPPENLAGFKNLDNIEILREKRKEEYVTEPLRIKKISNDIVVISSAEKEYYFDLYLIEIYDEEDQRLGGQLMMYDLTQEREMDRLRNEMINIIIHELKNPLSGVMGGTELLKSGISGMDKNEIYDLIGKSAEEMLNLINRFLEISKLENANTDHQRELTDISTMITDITQTMRPVFEKKKLTLNLDLQKDLDPSLVVPDLYADMVRNLLSNAVKYGPESRPIDVKLKTDNDQLILSVTDHGFGIDEKDREQIFKKFYRIKAYLAEQGTGLGLPYVLEIIKKHKGDIQVDSNEDIGSRFTVSIPYITEFEKQDA